MRSDKKFLGLSLAISGLFLSANAVVSPGRQYAFGFQNGNLIRNWSFENSGDNWHDENLVYSRRLAKTDAIPAISGSYVAKFIGTNTTGATFDKLVSDIFPVEEAMQYTLSFYVRTAGNTAGVYPVVWFYSNQGGATASYLGAAAGANYPVNAGWTLVSLTFTSPAKSGYAKVALIEAAASQGGTFYFDDLVFEKAATATDRTLIQESVAFVNDAGQVLESQEKLTGGGAAGRTYLVQANQLDAQKRPVQSYAPYINSGNPDYDPSFATKSQSYNNGSNGRGSLGAYPYSKVDYWEEPGDPASASYMPGVDWSTKGIKSGAYYVDNLTVPANPEAPATDDMERAYLLTWSKDVEGRYTYAWNNARGEKVQTAAKLGSVWRYVQYQYFPDGRLKKTLIPLDVAGGTEEFRQVTNYNSEGQVTSNYTKDRGLRKYWYNRQGSLRFSRHETQPTNEYDYTDYDFLDRPIAMGTQVISGLTQTMADDRATASGVKVEQKGFIYDSLDQFAARTGFTLAEILPGTAFANGRGRLVCDYNFNRGVDLSFLSPKDKFVATFYNYNKYGEVTEAYKYIGPIKDPLRKIHKVTYSYDSRHRMLSATLVENPASPTVLSVHQYVYDSFNRIVKITGIGGRFVSSYQYYDWGGLKAVVLGGTGTTGSGTRIDYTYHAQGWIKEIKATRQASGDVVYQQFLGYEDKAISHVNVPALLQTKFDGSITQQVYKFANDVNSLGPVRMVNYQYDDMNRMLTADGKKNSNANPLNVFQQIILSDLQWSDTEDMDTRMTFDPADRIQTNQSGVPVADKATYAYQSNSYRLDKVTGKLGSQSTRDASAPGTFEYDGRGRMTADNSKKLHMWYGWDDMPTEFVVEAGGFLNSDMNFYDASGKRITRLQVKTPILVPIMLDGITFFVKRPIQRADALAKLVSGTSDVTLLASGDRWWVELFDANGQLAASSSRRGIQGIGAQIGEITSAGNYRFFVKNHLGSTVRTVGDNGEFLDAEGYVSDFLSYGSSKDLKVGTTDPAVPKFTGKELELLTGLYAFGARWHDPELGMFMSPDPADQYSNPYGWRSYST